MDTVKDVFLYEDLVEELERRFVHYFRSDIEELIVYAEKSVDEAYSASDNKGIAESIDVLVTDLAEGLAEFSRKGITDKDDLTWLYENYGMLLDSGLNYAYSFMTLSSQPDSGSATIALIAEEPHFSRLLDLYETLVKTGGSEAPEWCDLKFQRRLRVDAAGTARLTTVYIQVRLDPDNKVVVEKKKDSYATTGMLI